MNNYNTKRKILSKIILISIYISLLFYILGDLQSIANWNYTFHEMLYTPLTLTIFTLPILSLLWFFYFIKSFNDFKVSLSLKKALKNFVIILSLIFIFIFFVIEGKSVSTSGIYTVKNKINIKNAYYIELNNKNIECTWNEYNLIEQGETYLIAFDWNEYWPNKGTLEYVEIVK